MKHNKKRYWSEEQTIWQEFQELKEVFVGINWNLKYRLKIEDLEHTIDDLRCYVRQLERKNKKLLLKTT